MAELKRPKKKAYPTWPKSPKSQTIASLQKYQERVSEVAKKRADIDAEYNSKMKAYDSQKKKKSDLIAGIAGIKSGKRKPSSKRR